MASGISDLFGVGTGAVGVERSAVRYSTGPSQSGEDEFGTVFRVGVCAGVCAVEACCGSVRVAVLVGVVLVLGIGDGVSPNRASAAVTLVFCGVCASCLSSSLSLVGNKVFSQVLLSSWSS